MKLWHLKRQTNLPQSDNPWFAKNDFVNDLIIRACSEIAAREVAVQVSVDNCDDFEGCTTNPWNQEKYTTCNEVLPQGGVQVITVAYAEA